MLSIGIFADLHDWHTNQIKYYLEESGCKVYIVNFSDLVLNFSDNKDFFFGKDFKLDGVWVRFLGSGSLEEITTKLTILHLLEEKKIYVHNSPKVIEKTVDKVRSTGIMKLNNITTPDTFVWKGDDLKKLKIHKQNFLIKPIFGSQGKNIFFLKKKSSLNQIKPTGNIFYLQKFIGNINQKIYKDIRVMVSNHRVICAMERSSKKFITNIYQGANFKKIEINREIRGLCKKISRIFNLGYGGIDLKLFKKTPYVLEINSIPAWKAIQQTEKNNIAKTLVKDFLKKIEV